MECVKCGKPINPDYRNCQECGTEIMEQEKPKQKYPALRTIASLYKILAAITLVAFIGGGFLVSGFNSVLMLLAGGIACLTLVAASEGIRVIIDIEANTRK